MVEATQVQQQGANNISGCSPHTVKCAHKRWTGRLFVQMSMYVLFVAVSMGLGGGLPWVLQLSKSGLLQHSTVGSDALLHKVYKEDLGYTYVTHNTYSYCNKRRAAGGHPLPRGYPAPPLAPKGSQLLDAWHHTPVTLRGVTWPGFTRQPAGLEGLSSGQSNMAATDFHAIAYQLKLLGFNTIRLPFNFQALKAAAANQTVACKHSSKAAWAARATAPQHQALLNTTELPDPPVYLTAANGSCNSYLPEGDGLERLLWSVQYLVANGFYVVLSYQPGPGEVLHTDSEAFALAWLGLWTRVTCLPTFPEDIRGRLLLDLLDEPSNIGNGLSWSPYGSLPGLSQLYLTAMDSIEGVTPQEALFLLQGSAVSHFGTTAAAASSGLNAYGLSPGDGFVLDDTAIAAYQLSDPKPFLQQLLHQPYSNRVVLAPHLLGPSSSGAVLDTPGELLLKMGASWGHLASEGFCSGQECFRLPVVAGALGSKLDLDAELQYYSAVSSLMRHDAGQQQGGANGTNGSRRLSGWIWSGYSNETGPGPLMDAKYGSFQWGLIDYMTTHLGLQPWYTNPDAWAKHNNAVEQRAAADAAAAAAATAATAAAKATVAAAARNGTGAAHKASSFAGTLQRLYNKAAGDVELQDSTVLPALAAAAATTAAANSPAATVAPEPSKHTATSSPIVQQEAPPAAPQPGAVLLPPPAATAAAAAPSEAATAPVPAPAPQQQQQQPLPPQDKPGSPSSSSSSSSNRGQAQPVPAPAPRPAQPSTDTPAAGIHAAGAIQPPAAPGQQHTSQSEAPAVWPAAVTHQPRPVASQPREFVQQAQLAVQAPASAPAPAPASAQTAPAPLNVGGQSSTAQQLGQTHTRQHLEQESVEQQHSGVAARAAQPPSSGAAGPNPPVQEVLERTPSSASTAAAPAPVQQLLVAAGSVGKAQPGSHAQAVSQADRGWTQQQPAAEAAGHDDDYVPEVLVGPRQVVPAASVPL